MLIIKSLSHFFYFNTLILLIISENITIPRLGTFIGSETITKWTNQSVYQFLGIKYARSPSGHRRFKKPKPAVTGSTDAVYFVQNHGRSCPIFSEVRNLSKEALTEDLEDCLNLSIYTKDIKGNQAVMIYIHGGGLEGGNSKVYSPGFLLEKNIVLCVIQYRIGLFGFLSTNTTEIPGNAGLEDVILALKWIKANIRYFGGNPKKITIFGQSAGSIITSTLVLTPSIPSDLFAQAIIQSGTYFSPWLFENDPQKALKEFLQFNECGEFEKIEQINQCLMNSDVLSLLEAYEKYKTDLFRNAKSPYPGVRFYPSSLLPVSPQDYIKYSEKPKNISIMFGVAKNDGEFIGEYILKQLNGTIGLVNSKFTNHEILERFLILLGVYDRTNAVLGFLENSLFDQEILMKKDYRLMLDGLKDISNMVTFKGPVFKAARHHANSYPQKTYLYSFDYVGQYNLMPIEHSEDFTDSVHHGDELLYLFPINNLNKDDRRISEMMVDIWTSFATNGIPESDRTPNWLPFKEFSGPFMHLDVSSRLDSNFLNEYTVRTKTCVSSAINDKKIVFENFHIFLLVLVAII